jgi:hypothetical protein
MWRTSLRRQRFPCRHVAGILREEDPVMTHVLLTELASQREHELAGRARRTPTTTIAEPRPDRRTGTRHDNRMVSRLRALVTGA